MKKIVSLLLVTLIVLTPLFAYALDWYTLLASSSNEELLELQTELETELLSRGLLTVYSDYSSPNYTPEPVSVYNGEMLTSCDYEGTCPFEVIADNDVNYYIYLDYQYAPFESTSQRELNSYAYSPYEDDIAFYLAKGESYELDVPVGMYKLYYATGETFYGVDLLFGDETSFFSSDDLLDFYSDSQYYHGHTITLTSVVNGNFDTNEIPESSFPR